MSQFWETIMALSAGFVVVALFALMVSRKSDTAQVIQAAASGYGNILDVAISPVTGATTAPNLSYPGGSGYGSITGGFSQGMYN